MKAEAGCSSGSGTIRAILVQTNGEVLAGGDASSGTAQKVWMFTPSGAVDTAFASGGTLTANSGATVYGWAVASGATQRIVVAGSYGGDEALAAFAPDSVRLYAEQEANYNVTAMVDAYGNVVQRMVYDAYGNMTVLSAAWTPQSDLFNTQVGFQGMWLDAASGLYHTLNRDYNAALGRWLQADPAGYVNGSSLYQSFDGAPTTLVDPAGEASVLWQMLSGNAGYQPGLGKPGAQASAQEIQSLQGQAQQAAADAASTASALGNARDAVAGFGDGAVPGYQYLRGNLGSDFAADVNSTAYAGGHLAGNVTITAASLGVGGGVGTGSRLVGNLFRGLGGGLAIYQGYGVYQQATNAANSWPCNQTKSIIQGADAAVSLVGVFAGLRGLFGGWGCFPAGTQVQMVDGPAAAAAGLSGAPERRPDRDWDWRYLQALEVCVIVAGAGYYLLWDHRRRRFLAMAKKMLDAVKAIELPLHAAPVN